LIEDADDIVELVTSIVEDESLSLTVATDGEEGLEAARKEPVDLILLDLSLPKISGWDMIQRLRAEGIQTPVVALTAHAMRGDRERILALGCDDYLSKPFEIDHLLAMLEKYTG
jgi:DNA-binding response OmpR family regulator